jgi:hypothetical protein
MCESGIDNRSSNATMSSEIALIETDSPSPIIDLEIPRGSNVMTLKSSRES